MWKLFSLHASSTKQFFFFFASPAKDVLIWYTWPRLARLMGIWLQGLELRVLIPYYNRRLRLHTTHNQRRRPFVKLKQDLRGRLFCPFCKVVRSANFTFMNSSFMNSFVEIALIIFASCLFYFIFKDVFLLRLM